MKTYVTFLILVASLSIFQKIKKRTFAKNVKIEDIEKELKETGIASIGINVSGYKDINYSRIVNAIRDGKDLDKKDITLNFVGLNTGISENGLYKMFKSISTPVSLYFSFDEPMGDVFWSGVAELFKNNNVKGLSFRTPILKEQFKKVFDQSKIEMIYLDIILPLSDYYEYILETREKFATHLRSNDDIEYVGKILGSSIPEIEFVINDEIEKIINATPTLDWAAIFENNNNIKTLAFYNQSGDAKGEIFEKIQEISDKKNKTNMGMNQPG